MFPCDETRGGLPGGRKPKGIGDERSRALCFRAMRRITGGQKAERHWRPITNVREIRGENDITGGQKAERHWRRFISAMSFFHSPILPGGRKPKGIGDLFLLNSGNRPAHYRGAESRKALETARICLHGHQWRCVLLPGGRKPKGIGDTIRRCATLRR